jgi:hypothetical protein
MPSSTQTSTSGPTASMTGMPASSNKPRAEVGYRPVTLTDALTTAAAFRLVSSSALIRSRSAWSMMAISPGLSRLMMSFVRRPTRATATIPGGSKAPPRNRSRTLTKGTFDSLAPGGPRIDLDVCAVFLSDRDCGHGAPFLWRAWRASRPGARRPAGLSCRLIWPGSRSGARDAPVLSSARVRGIPDRCPGLRPGPPVRAEPPAGTSFRRGHPPDTCPKCTPCCCALPACCGSRKPRHDLRLGLHRLLYLN